MINSPLPITADARQTGRVENAELADYVSSLRRKYTLNSRLLLIQPPQFILDTFNPKVARTKGCYAYPPTGLQCLSGALAGRGLEVDILDLNYLLLKRVISDDSFNYANWLEILDAYLEKNNPSIIGVTCISVYTDVFGAAHPLTSLLRHLSKIDKYIVIAGGPIATNEYDNYLQQGLCHFVVSGEGENKINLLFDYLYEAQIKRRSIAGVYFKFEGGLRETEGDNDAVIPKGNLIDSYKNIPIEDYHNAGSLNPFSRMAGQDRKFSVLQLNRGCRANCKFCGVLEFMGKGLRQYPLEDVLEEVNYQVETRSVRHFEILDDDFLGLPGNIENARALLRELVRLHKECGISWAAGNGLIAASLDEELLALMRDSGCVGFRIGIESGNEQMLKRMRKPTSLALLRKTGKMLAKYPEIFACGNYIIGLFAEETFFEMLDTFRFANELELDWAAFSAFQFTSKAKVNAENLSARMRPAMDFTPPKDTRNKEIKALDKAGISSGYEIFGLPPDTAPCPEQIKEIWFTFNLVTNYINNKNLKRAGRPEKFILWLKAVGAAYPENAYIPLFIALGNALLGAQKSSAEYLKITKTNLKASEYWRGRFREFDFDGLVEDFPDTPDQAEVALAHLRLTCSKYTDCLKRTLRKAGP